MDKERLIKLAEKLEAIADNPIENMTIQELHKYIIKEASKNIDTNELTEVIAKFLDELGEAE